MFKNISEVKRANRAKTRSEFIVFHRDGDRWPGRPIAGAVSAAGAYRTFAEAKQHAVASERGETGEEPGNRYSVWDAREQVWWPSMRNRASKRAEPDPKVYISRSATPLHPEGQYRVIQGGVPISPDKATAEEALAVARHYKLDVSDRMWDGDAGRWTRRGEANRAKSPARSRLGRQALPKATEVRVASLADIGVSNDPEAFYSIKGGRLIVRQRRAGKGLGAAKTLGTLPGYRKGLFYFVRNGAVYARRRK